MPKTARTWLFSFALTLAGLAALAYWLAARLPTFQTPPLDFYAMHPGEYFSTSGLTRRQAGSLKLGFAEHYPSPLIGAFGNHIISFFGADAFGLPDRAEYFFNYYYANLSLPEIAQFLEHLDNLGRLPKKLIIVQITPPDADNGRFIIDRGNELPPTMALDDLERGASPAPVSVYAATIWQTLEIGMHEILNYNTLVIGMLQDPHMNRFTGPYVCTRGRAGATTFLSKLPWTVRRVFEPFQRDMCGWWSWDWTLRRDGSTTEPREATAVLDEDALPDTERALHAGDEAEIVKDMRAIDAIGRRRNIPVVFLIPPVYETDRRDSVVNQIMDRALASAPDLRVIDDRNMQSSRALFVQYFHPSRAYFALAAKEMRARGYLPD